MIHPPSFNFTIKNYLARHFQAALSSLGQLSRAPFNTLMTCLVIGIAFALPMALFVLLQNIYSVSQNFQQGTQLTLYLKPGTTADQAEDLVQTLRKNANLSTVHTISPSQGIKELQQQTGVQNMLANLPENPLPWVIVAQPQLKSRSTPTLNNLSHHLMELPEIDSVQLDTVWVERLYALLNLAQRAVYALAVFLGIGVLLIVNNCIRTATQNNKKEIEIIKLIGGTAAFIRRPFLYAGILYGLFGGVIAWQLVNFLVLWIRTPVQQLASLYHSQFQMLGVGFVSASALLAISGTLGLAGAWIAVTRHLYRTKLG